MNRNKLQRLSLLVILVLSFAINLLFSQESFEVIDHTDDGIGSANETVVAADGTIFLANRQDGLRAYIYNGTSFENIAHIDNGGQANGVSITNDGTILLANGLDGLRAYTFDAIASTFTNTAHIDSGGTAQNIAIANDGTIYLANDEDGLRAFTYNGSSFTHKAHINNGGNATSVDVSPNGTIFLANYLDGLRAYSYDGASFSEAGHFDDAGVGWGVTVLSDSVVFFANGQPGLYALFYNGFSFTKTDERAWGWTYSSDISPNGTIFATSIYGVVAYTFNLVSYNFSPAAGFNNEVTSMRGVTTLSDSLVLFTNSSLASAGLYAYNYNDTDDIFTKAAYTNQAGGSSTTLTMGPDNTVLLGNGANGLRSYTLEGSSLINGPNLEPGFPVFDIGITSDGTVFFGYTSYGLWAYSYNDEIYSNAAHYDAYLSPIEVTVGPDGTIFTANGYSGLSAFSYNGSAFSNQVHIDDGGQAKGVAVGDDGTVFLANDEGLRAYTYDGVSFTGAGNIAEFGAQGVAVGPDNTIFVARGSFGVTAYTYDANTFTYAGAVREDLNSYAWDVAVGTDGTVFVAYHSLGLFAYGYDGSAFTEKAFINNSTDNAINTFVDIVVGNDGTIYSAQSGDGLYAYNYSGYNNGYNSPPTASDTTVTLALETYIFSALDFNYSDESEMAKISITRLENVGFLEFNGNDGWQDVTQYQDISKTDIDAGNLRFRYDGSIVDTTDFLFRVNDGTTFSQFSYKFTFSISSPISVESVSSLIPGEFALLQNYPNPFNPTTIIRYQLAVLSEVNLSIYNLLGEKVKTLVKGKQASGIYHVNFNVGNLSSGVYFYRLETGTGFVETKKLVVVK